MRHENKSFGRGRVTCLVLAGFISAIPAYPQTITTFDAPGATFTVPQSINPSGAIAGWSQGPDGTHGFVRDSGGAITTFDVPGAIPNLDRAISINPSGTIAGMYQENGGDIRGFVRDAGGAITTFDVPGATFSGPNSINPSGAIAGFYGDASGTHGFVRSRH